MVRETRQTARSSALRGAAYRIFGLAGLACVLLFALVGLLAGSANFLMIAIMLIVGILAIFAVSLFWWQRISERRIERLITQLHIVEKSRDEAEVARAENERMLAAMSHEIRTPLNGVIGMLNLLLGTPLTAEQKSYARTAHASGRTLLSIIEEILDTAKGRAVEVTEPKPSHIRLTIESVVELLAARAHAKGIEISAYVAPDVPERVDVDDTHLRQILFNLAGNAIKFTETGGVGIEVTRDQKELRVSVIDTGIGMTPVELERVFLDFQQANRTTARKFGGTGLGLGITKRLITRLGGTIDLTSTPGTGTTATVSLPAISTQVLDKIPALRGQMFGLGLVPGVTSDHLSRMLRDQGADVRDVDITAHLQNHTSLNEQMTLITDTRNAKHLRQWAKHRAKKSDAQIWTIVAPEERQSHADLLTSPFRGYLLKPVRPKSLSVLLAGSEDSRIAEAVDQLRTIAARAKPTRPLSILLADDNAINLLLTRTMLEKAGHYVTTARDGGQVLSLHGSQGNFDILLLDVDMPVMDGYETARALRIREQESSVAAPPLPILGLTAHMRQQDLEQCIAAGMNDYLSKPFDQHDLMVAIDRLRQPEAA